ncbi:uncharacterized protein LOC135707834 [Ochlerotatus camptorhynchus]|uniref:uncharacterized protein LOC135707834 n=1 Tax=Ochlerotatus camptorhynchus TaxID=644619 RepID=UPI0031D39910
MDPGFITIEQKEEEILTIDKYQSLVGALLYVAVCTRPDLVIHGRKVSKPTARDWMEAKRALRYLKGIAGLKLRLGGRGNLEGYADADWACDRTDRKSNSGFLFKLGEGVISWTARKQQCVTLSSTEAEYVALAEATKELLWLLKLMRGLGEDIQQPVTVYEDNQSCISMLSAEGVTRRTKHIDTRYNFVRDFYGSGVLNIVYCPSEEMLADALTKPPGRIKLQKIREEIG